MRHLMGARPDEHPDGDDQRGQVVRPEAPPGKVPIDDAALDALDTLLVHILQVAGQQVDGVELDDRARQRRGEGE